MKTLRSIICSSLSLLLAFGFNACKEVVSVNHQQAVISIVPQSLHLSYDKFHFPSSEEESLSLLVYSTNVEWEITDIPDWITVSPKTGGDGTTNVNITVALNTQPTDRVGVLSIKALDDSWSYAQTITVSQARGYYYAYPEKDRVEFDGSASNAVVKVSSNINDWTIEKDASFNWCTATKTEGSINITVTPNTNSWSRQGDIQISTLDSKEYITVVQRPANISTTTERLDFTIPGGSQSVQISSEAPWTATTSYSWINVTPESGTEGDATITVQVTANNSLTTRNGYVYIVLSDTRKIEIPVSQECISFSIDKTQIDAPVTGQDYQLQLKSNVQWKLLDSIPTWMTLSPKSGTGNSQIDIKVNANPSASDRSAKFKIAPVSLTNAATEITVRQNGHTFETDSTALHFSDKAGSAYFNIESDGSWIATPSADWITLDKESGTGDSKIKVTVTENTADSARVGYVNASIEGKQEKVTVHQQGKYLNISSDALEFTSKGGSTQVSIKTNNSWTAKSSDEWIKISKTEGDEDCDITITATDNASVNSRNGYVDVTPKESNPIRISVSQNARYLAVSVDTLYFFYKGGNSDIITVNTDGVFDVFTEADWLIINKETTNSFSLTSSPTDGVSTRSGAVNISLIDIGDDVLLKTVIVIQNDRYNGYEYIDLGLSVMWASCNIGAAKPTDHGSYYAWGEITTKDSYSWANYTYSQGTRTSMTKYCFDASTGYNGFTDSKTILDLEDDVAHVEWGGDWRMPTKEEYEELINNCSWQWTSVNGVYGYKISGIVAGHVNNYIFLPAIYSEGYTESRTGLYWSSSLSTNNANQAYRLQFIEKQYHETFDYERYLDHAIRPVTPSSTWLSNLSITLNKESVSLQRDETTTLTATVKKSNDVINYPVIWSSDKPSVATVNEAGLVTAISAGTANVIATIQNKSVTCSVTVTEKPYEYVDLGLSVNWATFNVGATKPVEYGTQYAWGEINSNIRFDKYRFISRPDGINEKLWKYCTDIKYGINGSADYKTNLELVDDIAHIKWGDNWRMPSKVEFEELLLNCTWQWENEEGVNGYRITSNISGYTNNSIFIPAGGYTNDSHSSDNGVECYYWSNYLNVEQPFSAWFLRANSNDKNMYTIGRPNEMSIRPVVSSESWAGITSLQLNQSNMSIAVGQNMQLIATVKSGDNTVHYPILWSSSNSAVATIDGQGNVSALSEGHVTLYASCYNKTDSCAIIVTLPISEYVDLGLSVNWATFNVGATKPEGYGNYYAWGEIEPKQDYSWDKYKYRSEGDVNANVKFTKYNTDISHGTIDNKMTLDTEDDVAHVKWGGDWRMPTYEEQKELLDNCTWVWTTENEIKGYRVTSKVSGYTDRSIFLPAAGCWNFTNLSEVGTYSHYWSSSLSTDEPYCAWEIDFNSDHLTTRSDNRLRRSGHSVRPVCPSETWLSSVSVNLNNSSKTIVVNDTCTLRATVKHGSDILNREITWSTGDSTIATVNETGFVTGKGAGTTTITATCLGKTATCTITVTLSEPEYVDLGLSVKWATYNIGASSPEEYGNYYAWGETETKSSYTWTNYKWCNNGSFKNLTKYNTDSYYGDVDNVTILAPEDDIAYVTYGGNWRMPTTDEMNELIQYCTWHWTTLNGVYGCLFTSKKVGYMNCSIFLPAGGYYQDFKLNEGSYGNYWTSSLGGIKPGNGSYLYFSSSNAGIGNADRSLGYRIRPVYDASEANNDLSINLNSESYVVTVNGSVFVTFTMKKGDNDDYWNFITYSSSNPSIAVINESGLITGVSVGTDTISVTCEGKTVTCTVTVKEFNPEYVDLGLSVNWATFNVDASAPEEYGNYYAYGEIEPNRDYYSWNYKFYNAGYLTKYCNNSSYGYDGFIDNKTVLDPEDDVAHVKWGGDWRIPTYEEIVELQDNCTFKATNLNGITGFKVTSNRDGYTNRSIFLPAAGYFYNGEDKYVGIGLQYLSSSCDVSYPKTTKGLFLLCSGSSIEFKAERCYGCSVRPVSPK